MNLTAHHAILMSMLGGLVLSTSAWGHGDDHAKMMDSNGDGMVSAAEHAAGAKMMFDKMDANHDGSITAAEMDAAHAAMMKDDKDMASDKGMDHGMSSADKIKTIDSNGDGMVSAAEHAAGSDMMFKRMDTNNDGNVSKAEMDAGHAAMMKGDSDHGMEDHDMDDHAMDKDDDKGGQ